MTFIRTHLMITATLAVGCLVLILLGVGQGGAAQLLASVFAGCAAISRGAAMIRDMVHGRWGVDLLAVTAIVSTIVVGEYIASLIVVLMLSGGTALEKYASGRAQAELTALLNRAPQSAHREGRGGVLADIAVREVAVGDILLIRPAEVVPVDGRLLSTAASFDESAITGESLPVELGQGDGILSGSLNGPVAVQMEATATADDSQYSRIVALVQGAASSRAPVVRLADRYAVPFTLLSLVIAGVAWLLSGDALRFAEVLVVATPCPLLIAAPVAFLGGMSRSARNGIIVKSGGTLEQLAKVATVVFDKTGTLTQGRPTLEEVRVAANSRGFPNADELLVLAASAEQYSSHVLASSVVNAALDRGLSLTHAKEAVEHATDGVSALVGDHWVVVGKRSFVSQNTGLVPEPELTGGQLAVYVGADSRYLGALIMSDPLRENAVETLAGLRDLGVAHTLMVTGDALSTAEHIAGQAGISQVRAGCRPADKVTIVRGIVQRPVMMVGDGINDAPVLAAADVGVAMGAKGSTAASESAHVVIMVDDLSKVASAVRIGKDTVRIAVQSIWIGILLSLGLMLFAAAGLIPAVAGALSQELVDLATIFNALRALKWGERSSARASARVHYSPPHQLVQK
ncbi:heavy metal translocating P-type ATPase [Arthrobacter glacialis]|uniref:heavy metal translocating P-type ATPase n=1 Tax=Arthrobacter glacialis TaxID=1664 RepID=UPI000CD3C124|nr:heavy metal translocating P-type ATPase [Arthrobacter glacialis]POH57798.1 cadmium-translocating P-type ATPase [Arthrobacter glacialis]